MKKFLAVISALIIILTLFTCCSKKGEEETTTEGTTQTTFPFTYETHVVPAEENPSLNEATSQPNVTANIPVQNNTTSSATKKPTVSKEGVVTYYSDNPDNKYIKTVAEKFGSNPANLIALIKTNAQYPGATVLEFDGSRASDGSLITTVDTLRYVYDVQDSGTINKSNKDGTDTYGYNKITGMTAYMLAEKYMIPTLPEYKQNMVYEDYFN